VSAPGVYRPRFETVTTVFGGSKIVRALDLAPTVIVRLYFLLRIKSSRTRPRLLLYTLMNRRSASCHQVHLNEAWGAWKLIKQFTAADGNLFNSSQSSNFFISIESLPLSIPLSCFIRDSSCLSSFMTTHKEVAIIMRLIIIMIITNYIIFLFMCLLDTRKTNHM
jgi:hypothetical protein